MDETKAHIAEQAALYAQDSRPDYMPEILVDSLKFDEKEIRALEIFGIPPCRYCGKLIHPWEKDGDHGNIHRQCRWNEQVMSEVRKERDGRQVSMFESSPS